MQIFILYSTGKTQLIKYRKSKVIKGVEIMPLTKDEKLYPNCQKIVGRYSWKSKIPIIPNENCTNIAPCNLCYLSVFEDIPEKGGFFSRLFK